VLLLSAGQTPGLSFAIKLKKHIYDEIIKNVYDTDIYFVMNS
jgi:hypothetical protein